MRKVLTLLLLAVLIVSLSAVSAAAQQTRGQQQGQQAQRGQEMQNAERMSKIIGTTARDQQGKELGKIEDVVVDKQARTVYLILSGDKVGKENQYIPIPWQAASPQVQRDAITLSLNMQKLQNAPSFPEDNWSQFNQVEPKVNSYFGAAGAAPAAPGASRPGQAAPGQKMPQGQQGTKGY